MTTYMRNAAVTLALFTLGTPAFAADLPVKGTRMLAPPAAAVWTGFYAGANIGYGWGKFDGTATAAGLAAAGTTNMNGLVGGGQLGYNWQAGSFVYGVEGDFQGSGERHTDSTPGSTATVKLDRFATVRGRIGVTPWDRGLLYGTGGWAWIHGGVKASATAGAVTANVDASAGKSGWVIGAGYEHMIDRMFSVKLEYLYMTADNVNLSSTVLGMPFAVTGRLSSNVVRAGLNYHF